MQNSYPEEAHGTGPEPLIMQAAARVDKLGLAYQALYKLIMLPPYSTNILI